MLLIGCSTMGAVVGCLLLADGQRIFTLWTHSGENSLYLWMVVSFSLVATILPYQTVVSVLSRLGRLRDVARLQNSYIVLACVAAGTTLVTQDAPVYFILLAAAEIGVGAAFLLTRIDPLIKFTQSAGVRGLMTAANLYDADLCPVWSTIDGQFELPTHHFVAGAFGNLCVADGSFSSNDLSGRRDES